MLLSHIARSLQSIFGREALRRLLGLRKQIPLSRLKCQSQFESSTGKTSKTPSRRCSWRTVVAMWRAWHNVNFGEVRVATERRMSTNQSKSNSRIRGHL